MPDNIPQEQSPGPGGTGDNQQAQAGPGYTGQQAPGGNSAQGTAPKQQQPDKWAGKTKEDVLAAYESLESKLGEQGRQIGDYKTFVNRILPYFEDDGQGNPVLNKDMLSKYAEQVLGYKKMPEQQTSSNGQPPAQPGNPQNDPEAFRDKFDENPMAALKEILGPAIAEAMKGEILPKVDELRSNVYKNQTDEAMTRFKDAIGEEEFTEWKDKMVKHRDRFNIGMNEGSVDDAFHSLVNLYGATKSYAGALVDKNKTDSLLAELQRSTTANMSGQPVSGPKMDYSQVTNAELFGLTNKTTEHDNATAALFGTSKLPE